MRFVEPPSLASPWRGRPGDELDGLLSAFFQSELPRAWPELELTAAPPTLPVPSRRPAGRPPVWRSRFALAASLALLLGGVGLLSGKFPEVVTPLTRAHGDGGTATLDRDDHPRMHIQERIIIGPSGQAEFRIDVEEPASGKKAVAEQLKNMLP